MARLLVVDDDPALRAALRRALELEGHEVQLAGDGAAALAAMDDGPDAVVLDVAMPNVDGLEVCRRLRARGDRTPVLVLTDRHQVQDRVAGLDAGADDYLVKPFALDELFARLRALLRRSDDTDQLLGVEDLVVDPAGRRARRGEREVELTKTEFDLLELLARNAGRVLTRELISERVWGQDFATSNSLEVYVGYLRRKLESGGEPRLLHTVRGVGYVLRSG